MWSCHPRILPIEIAFLLSCVFYISKQRENIVKYVHFEILFHFNFHKSIRNKTGSGLPVNFIFTFGSWVPFTISSREAARLMALWFIKQTLINFLLICWELPSTTRTPVFPTTPTSPIKTDSMIFTSSKPSSGGLFSSVVALKEVLDMASVVVILHASFALGKATAKVSTPKSSVKVYFLQLTTCLDERLHTQLLCEAVTQKSVSIVTVSCLLPDNNTSQLLIVY